MKGRSPGRVRRGALVLLLVLSCVGCDQVAKSAADRHLVPGRPISLAGDLLRLDYTENRGAFLGLGASWPPRLRFGALVLTVGTLLGAGLAFLLARPGLDTRTTIALALMIGGGAGNLVDRARLGFVRDFADLGVGMLRTGIFNVADLAIVAGALLLLADLAKEKRKC